MEKNTYGDRTIVTYLRELKKYLSWCNQKGYDAQQLEYKHCVEYIDYLQNRITFLGRKLAEKSIKQQIGVVKVYFKFLVSEDVRAFNPLSDFFYKIKRKYHHDLLSLDELEELYVCYPTLDIKSVYSSSVANRNKVMIGLIVYQGLEAKALKSLKVEHIDLNKGRVNVPGTRKSNGRKLDLKACQIRNLMQYLENDREVILQRIKRSSNALFPLSNDRISWMIFEAFKKLKIINFRVTNIKQLRASVLSLWVKQFDLRTAQYMAGHRNISSTNRFKKNNLDSQHEAVEMYHPMR